jgi:hypothetical protein
MNFYIGEVKEIIKFYYIDIEKVEPLKESDRQFWEITKDIVISAQQNGQYLLFVKDNCPMIKVKFKDSFLEKHYDNELGWVYFLISDYDYDTDIHYISESRMLFEIFRYEKLSRKEI